MGTTDFLVRLRSIFMVQSIRTVYKTSSHLITKIQELCNLFTRITFQRLRNYHFNTSFFLSNISSCFIYKKDSVRKILPYVKKIKK